MLRLYDYLSSGNGYKVRLLLTQLSIPFERVELDILKGETRTWEFLQKNLNGRIPVLQTKRGELLAESNAIMFYLAEGTSFLPPRRDGKAPYRSHLLRRRALFNRRYRFARLHACG